MKNLIHRYFDLGIVIIIFVVFAVMGLSVWLNYDATPTHCAGAKAGEYVTEPCLLKDAQAPAKVNSAEPLVTANERKFCDTPIFGINECNIHKIYSLLLTFSVPFGAAFTWCISFFVGEKFRIREYVFRGDDLISFIPIKERKLRKNTILLVGFGRSGKSELIDQISSRSLI